MSTAAAPAVGWARHAPAWVLLLAGLALFVLLAMGGDGSRMPGDPGDVRLVLYLFEHTCRWFTGGFFGLWGDVVLFDPAVFWPAPNLLAYSELFLGTAPLYWAWRLLGCAPHGALQAWYLTVLALDFAVFYRWLERSLQVPPAAAAVGAAVFAFCTLRLAEVVHPQVMPQFYTVLVAWGLTRMLADPTGPGARRGAAVVVAAAVAELYGSFYMGFFLGFGLLVLTAAALLTRTGRALLSRWMATRPYWALGWVALGGLALVPLGLHYLETLRTVGGRGWEDLIPYTPNLGAWLNVGPENWLWGRLLAPGSAPIVSSETALAGIGPLTTALAVAGLLCARRRWGAVLLAWLCIVALATRWPGDIVPWKAVFLYLPGAGGVRAVSRIAILTPLFAGLGTALLLQHLGRRRVLVAGAFAALALAELPRSMPSFSRSWSERSVAALAARVEPARCRAFYYSPVIGPDTPRGGPWYRLHWVRFQTEAMLAHLESGVPTVNGYTGNYPPHWKLSDPVIDDPEDPERLRVRLGWWMQHSGLSPEGFCWLQVPLDEPAP